MKIINKIIINQIQDFYLNTRHPMNKVQDNDKMINENGNDNTPTTRFNIDLSNLYFEVVRNFDTGKLIIASTKTKDDPKDKPYVVARLYEFKGSKKVKVMSCIGTTSFDFAEEYLSHDSQNRVKYLKQ